MIQQYESDINTYNGVPAPNVPLSFVALDGFNGTPQFEAPAGETTLDIEMAIAMAPGLQQTYEGKPWGIIVYEGYLEQVGIDGNGNPILVIGSPVDDVWAAMAFPPSGVPLSNQLSSSWTVGTDPISDEIFEEFALQGQSFYLASGDFGYYGNVGSGANQWPFDASVGMDEEESNITVVGGTILNTIAAGGSWSSEVTWNNSPTPKSVSSGGVVTANPPPYQSQGYNLNFDNNMNLTKNLGSSASRNLPDVSMVADNLFVVFNGGLEIDSGTSAAAPLWAALTSLVNQQGQQQVPPVEPLGFANPSLYAIGESAQYTNDFNDIIYGNNGIVGNSSTVNGTNGYPAVQGYDLATGWGSPKPNIINDLLSASISPRPTPCYSFSTIWGCSSTYYNAGQACPAGSGNGQFSGPSAIAVSGSYAYVLDAGNNRIEVLGLDGSFFASYAFPSGYNPNAIAVDTHNIVYVANANGVNAYSIGSGVNNGAQLFSFNGSTSGRVFSNPVGITVDRFANIYVYDLGNGRVVKYQYTGISPTYVQYLTAWGTSGTGTGQFSNPDYPHPETLAVDTSGTYAYVVDYLPAVGTETGTNNPVIFSAYPRIQKFNLTTTPPTYVSSWYPLGSFSNESWDPARLGSGVPIYVDAVAVGLDGNVYTSFYEDTNQSGIVSLSSGISISDTNGNALGAVGGSGPAGKGEGQSVYSDGVAFDGCGNLYQVDNILDRVQVFRVCNSTCTVPVPSNPIPGSYSWVLNFGAVGSGNGGFNNPVGLAVDNNVLFVADSGNNRIGEWDLYGNWLANWGGYGSGNGQFNGPTYLAYAGGQSKLYVADTANNRVQVLGQNGAFQFAFGSVGTGNGQFAGPNGVVVDKSNNVYVVDSGNNRVQQFTYSPGNSGFVTYVNQWGGAGSGNGEFNNPVGITEDANNNLYVVDSGNQRVQKFTSSGIYLTQWGSQGANPGQFMFPNSAAVGQDGDIYVSDQVLNTIQQFNPNGAYIAQIGAPGTGNGQFSRSRGLAFDGCGNLYASDAGNNRVEKFGLNGSNCTSLPSTPIVPKPVLTPLTPLPTNTATNSPTSTPTVTPTNSPTFTPTPTATLTFTKTWTITPSPTKTWTPTVTWTFTITPTATSEAACGTCQANLQLLENTSACADNQMMDVFEVVNRGAPVTLSDITFKFWSYDISGVGLTGAVNYGGCLFNPSCFHQVTAVSIGAVSFAPACGPDPNHQANWEITVSNTDSTVLNGGVSWVGIQTAVHRTDYGNFSPGTGYWYSPCVGSNYSADVHFAIYLKGNLVTVAGGVPPTCRPLPTCTPSGAKLARESQPGEGTGPTPTITPMFANVEAKWLSMVVAPNVSRDGEPVNFLVTLGKSAQVRLSIYAITGELIYQTNETGNVGLNSIPWKPENQNVEKVASGLYIYVLQVDDGDQRETRMGKVVVIH